MIYRGTQDSADEDEEQVGATPKARTGHLRPVATGQTQHGELYGLHLGSVTVTFSEFASAWLSKHQHAGLGEQYAQLEADDAAALGAEFKRRRMRDAVRGSAVARQRQIWERLLEIRIMLQRALTASHALPSPPGYEAAITVCMTSLSPLTTPAVKQVHLLQSRCTCCCTTVLSGCCSATLGERAARGLPSRCPQGCAGLYWYHMPLCQKLWPCR